MRATQLFLIAVLMTCMSSSTWAASRGVQHAVARPARSAPHVAARAHVAAHAHVATRAHSAPRVQAHRPASHHPAAKRFTKVIVRPRVIVADGHGDRSDAYCADGSSSAPVVVSPAPLCPPPAVDPLVQRNAARDTMDQVVARLTADMESTSQWNEMTATTTQALADLESAQLRIEATLSARPDYQTAMAQKQAAEELANQMNASGNYSPAEMTSIADRALEAGKQITQLQTQALSTDPQWLTARARLQATAAGRVAMQNQLHADVLNDPTWQAARQQLG